MLWRFPVRKQNVDGRLCEQPLQHAFIAVLLSTTVESGLDLGENNQRNPYLVTDSEPLGERSVALEKIREPVGIQRDSHFHLSQSIWRCEAIISSKAGSGVHRPTTSEKSARCLRPIVATVSSSRITWLRL